MGLLDFFSTSDKAMDTAHDLTNGVISGVDALVFTDEEKAQVKVEGMRMKMEFIKSQADQNSVRSKARRILAFMITGNFILDMKIAVACLFFFPQHFSGMVKIIEFQTGIVLLVLGFYFGVHAIRGWKFKKGGKK